MWLSEWILRRHLANMCLVLLVKLGRVIECRLGLQKRVHCARAMAYLIHDLVVGASVPTVEC